MKGTLLLGSKIIRREKIANCDSALLVSDIRVYTAYIQKKFHRNVDKMLQPEDCTTNTCPLRNLNNYTFLRGK